MNSQTLSLKTCAVRPFVPGDAEAIARVADNPRIAARLRNVFPSPYTVSDAEQFIALSNSPDYQRVSRAIVVDGVAAGGIGITPGERGEVHQRTAEVGYWLGERFWGRGVVTDALRGFTDHLFEVTDLLRIYATVYDGNGASCRVLEKAGFEKEGVMLSLIHI